MSRPATDPRVLAWAQLEAKAAGVPADQLDEAARDLLDTFRAATLQVQFASDDLAAQGLAGKVLAFLVCGWRPAGARARAAMLAEAGAR